MCKAAWKEDSLNGQEKEPLFRHMRTMGVKHVTLGWSKTLWTRMWIEHMYAYVVKRGTLARCTCFSLEGRVFFFGTGELVRFVFQNVHFTFTSPLDIK